MFKHRHHHILMAAIGAALSTGAAAVATAYPDDKLRLRHVDTEQECTFDDRSQVDTFLAGVPDPHSWKAPGAELEAIAAPADTAAQHQHQVQPVDATGSSDLAAAIEQANAQNAAIAGAGVKHIEVDLPQLHAQLAADKAADAAASSASASSTTEPAAPASTEPAAAPAASTTRTRSRTAGK